MPRWLQWTANVGDSRAVLCRAGVALPLSRDHKPKVTADGGLEVHYTNPPLTPQDERWYVLSRPQPD